MTQVSKLKMLADLSGVNYAAKTTRWRRLVAQETAIRSQLRTLSDHMSAQPVDLSNLNYIASGTDFAWRSWSEKQRDQLQIELAQILVQKAEETHTMKDAFGRREVAHKLWQNHRVQRGQDYTS